MINRNHNLHLRKQQSGVALFIALMLLLILTLLGLTSTNVSLLQERMAGNYVQSHSAFQIAEMTLRDIESKLMGMCSGGGSGGLGSIPQIPNTLELYDCTAYELDYGDTNPATSSNWHLAPSPVPQPGGNGWASYRIYEIPSGRCQPVGSLRVGGGASIGMQSHLVIAAGVAEDGISQSVLKSSVSCVDG